MYNLKNLQEIVHKIAKEKGFYDDIDQNESPVFFYWFVVTHLMLIVTEISEGVEGFRKGGDFNNLDEELADAIIRICDLAEFLRYDLDKAVQKKIEINKTRPHKHNKRF